MKDTQINNLITGRNEVVTKVIFLHLSVSHSVCRGGLSACWDTTTLPRRPPCQGDPHHQGDPPPRRPPLYQGDPPLPRRPPVQAHTQGGNWGGSDPGPHPRGKLRGIRSRPPPPPRKQTPAYGQWAAGTHPNGMHSCLLRQFDKVLLWRILSHKCIVLH